MEEKATIASLQEDGNVKNMDDKGYIFCRIHGYLQPFNPWEKGKTSLAYEDCRMKANGEGKEFTPSFSVGEHKISTQEGDVVNDEEGYFGLDPKEEHI